MPIPTKDPKREKKSKGQRLNWPLKTDPEKGFSFEDLNGRVIPKEELEKWRNKAYKLIVE